VSSAGECDALLVTRTNRYAFPPTGIKTNGTLQSAWFNRQIDILDFE